jgi:Cu2+-exporting ATPase
MSETTFSACPACNAAPFAEQTALGDDAHGNVVLTLPTIHCAACISAVERTLSAMPNVTSARVNLTLKRATIETDAAVPVEDFIKELGAIGYEAHELDPSLLMQSEMERAARKLLTRLAVSGFAMMNVMLLSVAVWSGADGITRDMFHWISAMIAVPATIYAAQPFFTSAWSVLRHRHLNMDVPISLAILLALVTSLYETTLSGEHAYFDAAISLTFFLLAGRYLDHRTRSMARSAAQELSALEVPRAIVRRDGRDETVGVKSLVVGDILVIRPGARLPVDGDVIDGTSEVDRSILTGETRPEFVNIGHALRAGELNLTGPLLVRATAVGQDTSLHQISELVAIAESGRSKYTSIADKAASLYAPGVHILSAISFIGWFLYSGDLRMSLNIASAVLIITCPCALGLAVPAVTTAASGRLYKKGLLIKSATALERIAQIDTVVFDKTGTLTNGTPRLVSLPIAQATHLQIAATLASHSSHPLSRALLSALDAQGMSRAQVTDVNEVPGFGIEGRFDGMLVRLGRAEWVGATHDQGTATFLAIGDQTPIGFEFADTLRLGARDLINELKAQGLDVHILSGDTELAVKSVAQDLGITTFAAGETPISKAAYISSLHASGKTVLMIGDGLNDTAALTTAHVSISPASALDAARVASDIVFLGARLDQLVGVVGVADQSQRRIKENFQIATLYNVVAVPIAIAGLATPLIAALAMSLSSITVSLNALRIK